MTHTAKYIVQHLTAGMDRNGNGKRAILIYHMPKNGNDMSMQPFKAVAFGAEGFQGALHHAGIAAEECQVLPEIRVTKSELKYQLGRCA